MNAIRKTLVLAGGLAFGFTLSACNNKKDDCSTNPSGPTCIQQSPPPPPCVQSVVASGTGTLEARTLRYDDFSVPDNGRLDATVDWTNASSRIGVYLVPANSCTLDEFNARSCNFLVLSEPSSVKPRKVSIPSFNAGNYRWLMGNFSESDESVSFQFVLSKGTCAALTGGEPTAFSTADDLPPIRRSIHF